LLPELIFLVGISQVNITGAGHVYINRYSKLGGGLQIGFAQKSVDYSNLQWGNQFDGMTYTSTLSSKEMITGAASTSYADVGAGVVYTFDNNAGFKRIVDNNDFKATVGLSIFHVSQPKYSFNGSNDRLYAKFVLHGNFLVSVPYTNVGFVPGFIVYKQGGPAEVYTGTLVRYVLKQKSKYTGYKNSSAVALGAYYRAKDAAVIAFLLEQGNYTLGMSYDVNVSRLKVASVGRGGFELSLRYTAPNPFITQSRSRF
jgi:type IX secretion system PorP/SprF family membrane protein